MIKKHLSTIVLGTLLLIGSILSLLVGVVELDVRTLLSGMPANHLILRHPLLLPPSIFPSIRVFPMSQFFASGGQSIGASDQSFHQ